MARLTFEDCCKQIADRDNLTVDYLADLKFGNPIVINFLKQAAELYAKSAQAEAWDACTDKWKDVITDEYRYEEPKNPYKDDN